MHYKIKNILNKKNIKIKAIGHSPNNVSRTGSWTKAKRSPRQGAW
jgi:hypothetical protein